MEGFLLKSFFFYFISAVAVISAIIVTFHKSIIVSAFSLLFTLLGVAGLYALLHADFLAIAQIVIYIGGVFVLFLFAVFLTGKIGEIYASNISFGLKYSIPIAILLFLLLFFTIYNSPFGEVSVESSSPTTKAIGDLLLKDYLLPFEIVSVVLLAALIGAVFIARREVREEREK